MDSTVRVRMMVKDVPASVAFYTGLLGFTPEGPQSPAFGAVRRDNLLVLLSGAASSAARPMPDGRVPEPGGWNRFQLICEDIDADAARLRAAGVTFRNEVIRGPGGAQTVFDDPSGNPIELFQPAPFPA
ncbi:MAG: VOC family protein [Dehalococcoidia bacterium]|nr:MAG: VOC family protein [Dehalococcoidia bacterium]